MNIFDKLLLAKEMSFTEGKIQVLGNRVVLPPANFFSEFASRINDSPEMVDIVYQSAKVSFRDGIAKTIGKKYGFNINDFYRWLTDIATMAGWGILKWEEFDAESKKGVIFVEDSPVASDLKGKVKSPCDHVVCGFIAGGTSALFMEDMDVVETECLALGAPRCKFIAGPAKTIKR